MVNMMWTYSQLTGTLWDPLGIVISIGYSGYGDGKNNPAMEDVKSVGPIPKGAWVIGDPYDSKKIGPFALPLRPHCHGAHGRTYFRVHGDSASNPGGASKGCILFPRSIRENIFNSQNCLLNVVE
jgi:hypothetical protein